MTRAACCAADEWSLNFAHFSKLQQDFVREHEHARTEGEEDAVTSALLRDAQLASVFELALDDDTSAGTQLLLATISVPRSPPPP